MNIHQSMMFLYHTRRCPVAKSGEICPNESLCFDSHDHKRRRPRKTNRGWNYSTNKCTTGYPNTPENCKHGNACFDYHNSDEFKYHPLEYKTKPCRDPQFLSNKDPQSCSRGIRCWQFHGNFDRRSPRDFIDSRTINMRDPPPQQYMEWIRKTQQQSVPSPPQQNSSTPPPQPPQRLPSQMPSDPLNRNSLQQDMNRQFRNREPPPPRNHNINDANNAEEKSQNIDAKWFHLFKLKPCSKGESCQKGMNCMEYHGATDKRRSLSIGYESKPCPEVFDYFGTGNFRTDIICSAGDSCRYSHNQYEMMFHQNTWKVFRCPYLSLTQQNKFYKEKECPFKRDRRWFEQMMADNPIKKIRGNIITHHDGQHTCLDYCCFYHDEYERRKSNGNSSQASPIHAQPPQSFQQQPQRVMEKEQRGPLHMMQQPMPAYGPQRGGGNQERSPPHYGGNARNAPPHMIQKEYSNNNNNVNMNRNSYNMNKNAGGVGVGGNKAMSKTDRDQRESEKNEWGDPDSDAW